MEKNGDKKQKREKRDKRYTTKRYNVCVLGVQDKV